VEDEEDIKSGFKITFVFAPDNPFFSEQKLVKVRCKSKRAYMLFTTMHMAGQLLPGLMLSDWQSMFMF
jgi:hypothetical protein